MHIVSLRSLRYGFSMVGMLITMACIAVLFAIMMQSLSKVTTGQGTQQQGTVRSFEDKMYLDSLYQWMVTEATNNKEKFLVPSNVSHSSDVAENTTANLYSAMVMSMGNPQFCHQLISGNEYSGYVEEKTDYDLTAYNPARKIFWDKSFAGDLANLSNVSFAHMPLFGERLDRHWRSTMSSQYPLIGNRGPKDGVNTINSLACGKDGIWRGHLVFGDGHIAFTENPVLNSGSITGAGSAGVGGDNIFKMESGPKGGDIVIGFTRTMKKEGPELQFD